MENFDSELMTVGEVAKLWKVHVNTIVRYYDSGKLKGFVPNPKDPKRTIRIYKSSVLEVMGLKPPEPTNGQTQEVDLSHMTTTV